MHNQWRCNLLVIWNDKQNRTLEAKPGISNPFFVFQNITCSFDALPQGKTHQMPVPFFILFFSLSILDRNSPHFYNQTNKENPIAVTDKPSSGDASSTRQKCATHAWAACGWSQPWQARGLAWDPQKRRRRSRWWWRRRKGCIKEWVVEQKRLWWEVADAD